MRGFTAPVTVLNEGQKIAFDVVVDRKNPAKSSADNLQAV
jgi:cold shock CspA family protein